MAEDSEARWTCEACGCHTNTVRGDPITCGVCGTRREPMFVRRGYPPRPFHGGFSGEDEEDDEDEGLEYHNHRGDDEDHDSQDEETGLGGTVDGAQAAAAAVAALDASGVVDAAVSPRHSGSVGSRVIRAVGGGSALSILHGSGNPRSSRARGLTNSTASSGPPLSPETLQQLATENAVLYRPQWTKPSPQASGRLSQEGQHASNTSTNDIIVDTILHPNVAHLPEGAGEGRAVRASPPFPRSINTSSTRGSSQPRGILAPTATGPERKRRRVFGFRAAFDHPCREERRSMGGCYLVGITTSAFTAFGERSGLQQSRLFWGIEDGGRKYEGSIASSARRRQISSGGRPGSSGSSAHGVQLTRSEAPRNPDNVLFGSREVLTVVVDLDSRTVSYWRGGTFLGTLVTNLPRSGNIYPVAVPFNGGVSVAVTGMDGDPLSVLSSYHAAQKRARQAKEDNRRLLLAVQRSKLIQGGGLTPQLLGILQTIFSWYKKDSCLKSEGDIQFSLQEGNGMRLDATSAALLWYRCGMRLDHLRDILNSSSGNTSHAGEMPSVTADIFISVIASVVREEEEGLQCSARNATTTEPMQIRSPSAQSPASFQVGDRVEVSDGYEKYGDAASGPLRPGHRGTVMEVQQGPRGDRQSIRVVYNGRRWWYQPQALLSERSRLIESVAVRFIRTLLRSHGYDHTTLQPLWGKVVTPDSWEIGDLVVPLNQDQESRPFLCPRDDPFRMIGRIVEDTSSPPSSASRGRESGLVAVEFADPLFGTAVGAIRGGDAVSSSSSLILTRRVKVQNLVHTTFHHGLSVLDASSAEVDAMEVVATRAERDERPAPLEQLLTTASNENFATDEQQDDEDISDGEDYIDAETDDDDDDASISGPIEISDAVKKNIARIAQLDSSAIRVVTKECGKNSSSLAGLFAVGLPNAILSGIDNASRRLSTASSRDGVGTTGINSLSTLITLALAVSNQLFSSKGSDSARSVEEYSTSHHTEQPCTSDTTLPAGDNQNAAQGRVLEQAILADGNAPGQSWSLVPNQPISNPFPALHLNQTGNGAAPRNLVSVRDLIRDLGSAGSSVEQRRGVLLALMASARSSDNGPPHIHLNAREMDFRNLSRAHQQRDRLILSSYERLNAEAAALGLGSSQPPTYRQQNPRQHLVPPPVPPLDELRGMLSTSTGAASTFVGDVGTMPTSAIPSLPPTSPARPPAIAQESETGRGTSPLLESLIRGHHRVINAAATTTTSLSSRGGTGTNARSSSSVSASTRSLIHGILLNSSFWVRKALRIEDESPSPVNAHPLRDEDGVPVLLLAISMGCSTSILKMLIRAGTDVGDREVHEAAVSNQSCALSLLLRHAVYSKGSIDVSRCSAKVNEILTQASERQTVQEKQMEQQAGEFGILLLRKLIDLGLKCRLLLKGEAVFSACSRAVSEALVGNVLLHAIHKSQQEGLMSGSIEGSPATEDCRVPAFSANQQGAASSSMRLGAPALYRSGRSSSSSIPFAASSLLDMLPSQIVCEALCEETRTSTFTVDFLSYSQETDQKGSRSFLTAFLRLTELFLWSKDMRDSAMGLTLAVTLLQKAPSLCKNDFSRYGVEQMAKAHLAFAGEALKGIKNKTWQGSTPSSPELVDQQNAAEKPISAAVVKCPKGHTTMLHLTRHSSFRCDLCGKGVDQGQPMHGCRECDWDACESCTDKAEGGLVKWCYIRDLATECLRLSSCNRGDEGRYGDYLKDNQEICSEEKELLCLSTGLQELSCDAVRDLAAMLKASGRITFHEFSTFVLPALHSVLVCGKAPGRNAISSRCSDYRLSRMAAASPRRRSKKPRVGLMGLQCDEASKISDGRSDKVGNFILAAPGRDIAEREAFVRTVVDALILSPQGGEIENCMSPAKAKNQVDDGVDEVSMDDDRHDDEGDNEEDSDDESADEEQGIQSLPKKKEKATAPPILYFLHTVLAFNENTRVIRYSSGGPSQSSDTCGGGGELESLTLPFEIDLRMSTAFHSRSSDENSAQACLRSQLSTCPTSEGAHRAIVHVEPLMPLAEVQLHILRTCPVRDISYTQFCRKLALDRAIIAERPKRPSDLQSQKQGVQAVGARNESTQIARVVAFDESTGAHVVRYASHFVPVEDLDSESNDYAQPLSEHSLSNQLDFHGKEAMLILAAREYSILHRDESPNSALNVGDQFDMESGAGDDGRNSEFLLQNNMGMGMTPFLSSTPDIPLAYRGIENNGLGSEALLCHTSVLPVGTRVEADIKSRGEQVYTIISAKDDNASSASLDLNEENCPFYALVSDAGEVFVGVSSRKVRGHDAAINRHRIQNQKERTRIGQEFTGRQASPGSDSVESARGIRSHHSIFERGVPVASVRGAVPSGSHDSDQENPHLSTPAVGVLKRTWSALSPLQKMNPLDLSVSSRSSSRRAGDSNANDVNNGRPRKLSIGGNDVVIDVDPDAAEKPPFVVVEFSMYESLPTVSLPATDEITLISGLHRLWSRNKSDKCLKKLAEERKCTLYYKLSVCNNTTKSNGEDERQALLSGHDVFLPALFSSQWTRQQGRGIETIGGKPTQNSSAQYFTINALVDRDIERTTLLSTGALNLEGDERHKPNATINVSERNQATVGNQCDGLNDTCIQCMELLRALADHAARFAHGDGAEDQGENVGAKNEYFSHGMEQILSLFESEALTSKLLDQLEDPLAVVGCALPDWCTAAPAFAPLIFSHASRRLLLERSAFGVSRSALRQQEAKVAVGPLRQRMAALRARAVELVGEAFSGGAADPTALQLQADELYAMEEALAARVNAAFRAQRWDEHSLQCAKAAVRRNELLADAAAVMEHYASDDRVRRRRLEVRFDGESGFDAASGDEAGVTRGFYADVAEALLSCDHVAGVFCPPNSGCPKEASALLDPSGASHAGVEVKLPLWIPDMDSSRKVIIPTPRADPSSGLGVFPRPISPRHPQFQSVIDQFRFMGRLFAAALRDGFIFPLPLSTAFLKLVQSGALNDGVAVSGARHSLHPSSASSVASGEYLSNNSVSSIPSSTCSSPGPNSNMSVEDPGLYAPHTMDYIVSSEGRNSVLRRGSHNISSPLSVDGNNTSHGRTRHPLSIVGPNGHAKALGSLDLPRPGFLGGDVFAVERYICAALDKIDKAQPMLSLEEVRNRRQEIASDKQFARKALSKSYDCSFEDYFEDRTFVDPLDPTQGDEAFPLCANGHLRSVTIENVREWVILCKKFLLYDGVISQAIAFRRGVGDFFSVDALRLFNAEELQRDVCGGGDDVDKWDENDIRSLFKLDGGKGAAEALVAVAAIGGEGGAALSRRFGPTSPTIGYLVKALIEASVTQRRQFLSFVTSVPIVTPGEIEVVPVVNPSGDFLPMSDQTLPRANTCARRLYLPKFDSYKSFSQVLWAVVREECRFKGFYEWRGC